jgi:hypothetical protein
MFASGAAPEYHFSRVDHESELSNKMILKRDLIPTQGDPENGTGGAGMHKRLNADRDAERRDADRATDRRVSEGQRGNRICRSGRAGIYQWTEQLLVAQEYAGKGKRERGAIRRYASKVTGLSLPQITRLIRSYRATGTVVLMPSRRRRFPGKYPAQDVQLLAAVDNAHERLSGPATKCILKREYKEYGKVEFARLSEISVSHIYNLRASAKYRRVAANFEATRPSPVSIGERRRPAPLGRPGFLRIDTVHQGDWGGEKGVYHINAVDAVTQWEIVGCTPRINAENLKPVLEAMLHQFPFPILGAHFDNGSEYINYSLEEMMKAMIVEFTKSRACRSQDNALVEGKNGAISESSLDTATYRPNMPGRCMHFMPRI